jgi:predicted site-specific integrase-resolvase
MLRTIKDLTGLLRTFVVSSYSFRNLWRGAAAGMRQREGTDMQVIGYTRVSTHDQVQEGVGLVAQQAKIEAYAVVKDWTLR